MPEKKKQNRSAFLWKEKSFWGLEIVLLGLFFCKKRSSSGRNQHRTCFSLWSKNQQTRNINGKSFSPSRRRIEQRSLPFCYETFRYESGKIVLLYYFLTMLWIISNSALPFTVSLNRCYRKRAVYDTTFRWKANSKTAHHYRKITERGTIAKQKSRH